MHPVARTKQPTVNRKPLPISEPSDADLSANSDLGNTFLLKGFHSFETRSLTSSISTTSPYRSKLRELDLIQKLEFTRHRCYSPQVLLAWYGEEYQRLCQVLQRAIVYRHKEYGTLESLPTPNRPFETITLDFITGLPPSSFDMPSTVCK